RDYRRAGVATLQHSLARIEMQTALKFFASGAVALVATLDEKRADFHFEKLVALRRRGVLGGMRARGQHESQDEQTQPSAEATQPAFAIGSARVNHRS